MDEGSKRGSGGRWGEQGLCVVAGGGGGGEGGDGEGMPDGMSCGMSFPQAPLWT